MNGNWSLDGKKVYFDAGGLVWRVTLPSGPTEKVTSEPGTGQAAESVDGKYVYYRARGSIWRVPVAGGKEEEVFAPENGLFFTTIEPVRNGIYYLEWERRGRGMAVSFYDFAARKSSVVLRMNGVGNFARFTLSFSVSPDGKYIVYPKVDRDDTSLMMLEHFR
jgi:Tol biopolymer transport system component